MREKERCGGGGGKEMGKGGGQMLLATRLPHCVTSWHVLGARF